VIKIILILLFLNISISQYSYACVKNSPYIIGVQAIDYSPHYNFIEKNMPSYFSNFIQWVENKTQCKFIIKALPIKRLNIAFSQQSSIDFIYPDNTNWHTTSDKRIYSNTIALALGGTIVRPENANLTLEEFNTLAIPSGFTPVAWLALQKKHQINIHETANAKSALLMTIYQRADGADVEYNVANHLIAKHQYQPLVLAKNLPFTPTSFHISTFNHPEVLNIINKLIKTYPDEIRKLKKQVSLIESL